MKIIGTGLACLDIINRKDKNISVMNGGTCANVLTVLAQLGEDAFVLIPEYNDDIQMHDFCVTFEKLNVGIIFWGETKQKIPRIVETYDDNFRHIFYTKCPICHRDLIKNKFVSIKKAKELVHLFQEYDVFFTDRISGGIKKIAGEFNKNGAKVVYEPNSGRNIKALVEMAKLSNVMKFSTDRISMSVANNILMQVCDSKLELVIATHGENGLSFCYKLNSGAFSGWIKGPYIEFKNIIDTSGAGDWLTAGFLHYWNKVKFNLSEVEIYEALKQSLKLSEIASMAQGAQGVFFNKEALEILNCQYDVKLETPLEKKDICIEGHEYCEFCLSECNE